MPTAIYIHDHVQQVINLYQEILDNRTKQTTVWEELSSMAEVLQHAHRKGNVAAKIQLSNWHPELVGGGKGKFQCQETHGCPALDYDRLV